VTEVALGRAALIGTGALGASLGAALRSRGLARAVVGHDPAAAARALELGHLDRAAASLAEAVAGAELVLIAVPPPAVAEVLLEVLDRADPAALVTDLTSVKGPLLAEVEGAVPAGAAWVPSHPLCRTDGLGPDAARADLPVGWPVVLTPGPDSVPGAIERLRDLWRALGASEVRQLDPVANDLLAAATRQLPHVGAGLAAAALDRLPAGVSLLDLEGLGGPSLSAAPPGLDASALAAHLVANREAVAWCLERSAAWLEDVRERLAAGDASGLAELLAGAQRVRRRVAGRR